MAAQDKIRLQSLTKVYGDARRHARFSLRRRGIPEDERPRSPGEVVALDDVSFTVAAGEIFVVMGLSGSGKSTLIRCINRLVEPTSGEVYVDGEAITTASKERLQELRRTKMAMVFQSFGLFPHRDVAFNVGYGVKIRGVSEEARRAKIDEALRLVGLEEWADKYPHELSGGMQQRVGLARALATDADILLMDEAFSALDPLIRHKMQAELLGLQARLQRTILFITHDLDEALRIGDRIAIMRDGKVVQVGTAEDIVSRPADAYVAAFTAKVDAMRVLTAGSVMQAAHPLVREDTVEEALARMRALAREHLYVVDGDDKVVGLARRRDLEDGAAAGTAIATRLVDSFTPVHGAMPLAELFETCSRGLPIAVVTDDGKLQGIVDPLDVFSTLSAVAQRKMGAPPNEVDARPLDGKSAFA